MFDIMWIFKIFIFLFWYIVLPGLFISAIKDYKKTFIERIGVSFALGYVLFSLIVLFGYLYKLNISYINNTVSIFNLICMLYYIKSISSLDIHNMVRYIKLDCRITYIVLITLSISGAYFALNNGWFPRGDASIHMQAIINIIASGNISHPVYSLSNHPIIPDHFFDTYYFLLALISVYTKLEVSVVWHYILPIFSLLIPFSIYAFLKGLTKDKKLIIFSLISFYIISLQFWELTQASAYIYTVYPNHVYLFLILPIGIKYFFDYMKYGNSIYLVMGVLIVVSQIFIHQSGFLFYILISSGILFLSLFKKNTTVNLKRGVVNIIIIVIVALPFIYLKMESNNIFIDIASTDFWIAKYKLFDGSFPFPNKYKYIMIYTLFFSLFLFLLKTKFTIKNEFLILTLVSTVSIPYLITYNPLVVPYLAPYISYVPIGRMARTPLYYLALGVHIYIIYSIFQNYFKNSKIIYTIFVYVLVAIAIFLTACNTKHGNFMHNKLDNFYLGKLLNKDSTILSDLITSSDIVSFHKANAVVIKFNGTDIYNIESEKYDIHKVINVNLNKHELESILSKYNVDYVIISKLKFKNYVEFYKISDRCIELYEDKNYKLIKYMN